MLNPGLSVFYCVNVNSPLNLNLVNLQPQILILLQFQYRCLDLGDLP